MFLGGGGPEAPGFDDVILQDDAAQAANRGYTVNDAVVNLRLTDATGANPPTQAFYSFVEGLEVNAGGGNDVFTLNRTALGTPVTLNGRGGDDVFRIPTDTARENLLGPVEADGGAGRDWLDYSGLTEGVFVDLGAGVATGFARGISDIENVLGSAGDDDLFGSQVLDLLNGESNILSGLAGDDEIDGRGGRDILIGGGGRDVLRGGPGDDILIGDIFADQDDRAALEDIMAIWGSPSLTFVERVMALSDEEITDENRFGDAFADVLDGGPGSNWVLPEIETL
jgi:Ca2+-binding RTX toxin-like protein